MQPHCTRSGQHAAAGSRRVGCTEVVILRGSLRDAVFRRDRRRPRQPAKDRGAYRGQVRFGTAGPERHVQVRVKRRQGVHEPLAGRRADGLRGAQPTTRSTSGKAAW